MPVTRDEVMICYRHLLGREPENDFVVRDKIRHNRDLLQLIETFIESPEFRWNLDRDAKPLRANESVLRHAEIREAVEQERNRRAGDAGFSKRLQEEIAVFRSQDYALVKRILMEQWPRHWPQYSVALLLTAFVATSSSLFAYLSGTIVNATIAQPDFKSLVLLSATWIALFALRGLSIYGQDLCLARAGNRVTAETQHRIFNVLLKQNLQFFANRHSTEFMANTLLGASSFASTLNHLLLALGRDLLSLICLLSLMVWLNPMMSLISLTVLPPALVGVERLVDRARAIASAQFAGATNIIATMQETVQGFRLVKAFNLEASVQERAAREILNLERVSNELARVSSWSSPLVETFGGIAIAVACLYGGYSIMSSNASPGEFVTFVLAFILILDPARRLARLKIDMSANLVIAHGLIKFLNTPASEADDAVKPCLQVASGDIEFKNVHFSYNPGIPVLKDLSFVAEAGKVTALIGCSGAGKTTVFNLLLRMHDGIEGNILIDKQDITSMSRHSVRDQISYVGQEIYLFHGSIRENILMGKPDASDAELIEAAKNAFAHDFIMSFPEGYDTQIGECGSRLSLGQRQRIAIARAMIKTASIVLLDEPTNALDSESEYFVRQALKRLCVGKTTIVIAHRLNTVCDADRILVIENGTVVESGKHTELLEKNGRYANFFRLQFP